MFSEHLFQEHVPKGGFSLRTINSRQLLGILCTKLSKETIEGVISAHSFKQRAE